MMGEIYELPVKYNKEMDNFNCNTDKIKKVEGNILHEHKWYLIAFKYN